VTLCLHNVPQADTLLCSFSQAITLRIVEAAVLVVRGEEVVEVDAATWDLSHTPSPTTGS
jgi:hypothetical protein